MDTADVLDIANDAIWTLLTVAGPSMAVATTVGVLVAFFQALTQIQEMTLTFVPKIVTIMLSLLIFLPFMMTSMIELMQRMMARAVGLS
ncbi:MAG: flagellar biosynthesis protein FliQ [Sneathiellaceae bacterium]|uniref:flagellar biosynthesis protein FliQ n=1 Tax=Marinovum algicola TaxID=42444 RepID=UPI0032EBDD05